MTIVEMSKYGQATSPVFSDDRPFIAQIKIAISSSDLISQDAFEAATLAAVDAVAKSLNADVSDTARKVMK